MVKSVVIVVLVVLLLALIGVTLYLYFRRRYTRERFAFFAVTTLSSLLLFILSTSLGTTTIFELITKAINKLLERELFAYEDPDKVDTLIALLGWFGLAAVIRFLYVNWNSDQKTQRQYNLEQRRRRASLLADFRAYLQTLVSEEELVLYREKATFHLQQPVNKVDHKKAPWHERAAEHLS